jgi:hypothetical protein
MDSGRRITGGGSWYAAILAHAEGALYGTELGSVEESHGRRGRLRERDSVGIEKEAK